MINKSFAWGGHNIPVRTLDKVQEQRSTGLASQNTLIYLIPQLCASKTVIIDI